MALQRNTVKQLATMFFVTLYLTRNVRQAAIHSLAFCVIGLGVTDVLDLVWPVPVPTPTVAPPPPPTSPGNLGVTLAPW